MRLAITLQLIKPAVGCCTDRALMVSLAFTSPARSSRSTEGADATGDQEERQGAPGTGGRAWTGPSTRGALCQFEVPVEASAELLPSGGDVRS